MNFLFHLFLSGDDPAILTGNFMGDFVKGRLDDRYPESLRHGLMLHRRIDSFAHHDPVYRQSRQRLSVDYGLYRGVLVDLFYDHFLVAEWGLWSEESFDSYLTRVRKLVELHHPFLPSRLQDLLPVIFSQLLPSYGEVAGIGAALDRMSRRLKRPNPLCGGEGELVRHYDLLRGDFRLFMPKARLFASAFIAAGNDTERT